MLIIELCVCVCVFFAFFLPIKRSYDVSPLPLEMYTFACATSQTDLTLIIFFYVFFFPFFSPFLSFFYYLFTLACISVFVYDDDDDDDGAVEKSVMTVRNTRRATACHKII